MRGRYKNGEGMAVAGECKERPLVRSVRSVDEGKGEVFRKTIID
jgi:hypothetical protein